MIKVPENIKDRLLAAGKFGDYVKLVEQKVAEKKSHTRAKEEAFAELEPEIAAQEEARGIATGMRGKKACSYTETVRWAFINARLGKPVFNDAPSAEAWCLMLAFQESPAYAMDIYKQVISAKVKKEEIEEVTDENRWDGKAEYDILGGLSSSEAKEMVG